MANETQDLFPIKFTPVFGAKESVQEYLSKARLMIEAAKAHGMECREGLLKSMCQQAIADLFHVRDIFHRMCNHGARHPNSKLAEKADFAVNIRNCISSDMMKFYDADFAFVLGAINSPFLYTDDRRYVELQQAAAATLFAALEVLDTRIAFMQGQTR